MADVLYVRVSSTGQNPARQYEIYKERKFDRVFEDIGYSGKSNDRPAYKEMMSWIRSGDRIFIEDFTRVSRSLKDLLNLLDILKEKGVELISYKENLDSSTPAGKLFIQIAGAIAEYERMCLLDRQREGIELAKKIEGKYRGRKELVIPMNTLKNYKMAIDKKEITVSAVAKELGITRQTLYRKLEHMKEMEADSNG